MRLSGLCAAALSVALLGQTAFGQVTFSEEVISTYKGNAHYATISRDMKYVLHKSDEGGGKTGVYLNGKRVDTAEMSDVKNLAVAPSGGGYAFSAVIGGEVVLVLNGEVVKSGFTKVETAFPGFSPDGKKFAAIGKVKDGEFVLIEGTKIVKQDGFKHGQSRWLEGAGAILRSDWRGPKGETKTTVDGKVYEGYWSATESAATASGKVALVKPGNDGVSAEVFVDGKKLVSAPTGVSALKFTRDGSKLVVLTKDGYFVDEKKTLFGDGLSGGSQMALSEGSNGGISMALTLRRVIDANPTHVVWVNGKLWQTAFKQSPVGLKFAGGKVLCVGMKGDEQQMRVFVDDVPQGVVGTNDAGWLSENGSGVAVLVSTNQNSVYDLDVNLKGKKLLAKDVKSNLGVAFSPDGEHVAALTRTGIWVDGVEKKGVQGVIKAPVFEAPNRFRAIDCRGGAFVSVVAEWK